MSGEAPVQIPAFLKVILFQKSETAGFAELLAEWLSGEEPSPIGGLFSFLLAQKREKKGRFPRPPRERIRVPFVDSGKDFKLNLLCVPCKTYNAVPNITVTFILTCQSSHESVGYALAMAKACFSDYLFKFIAARRHLNFSLFIKITGSPLCIAESLMLLLFTRNRHGL